MKNLRQYGDMFGELVIKIEQDLKIKSDEELNELENEAKSEKRDTYDEYVAGVRYGKIEILEEIINTIK